MVTYTVHERESDDKDVAKRADGILFVKEGFAWLALFFPVLWMLVNGMWLILLGFLVFVSALQGGLAAAGINEMVGGWFAIGVSLLFALLANDLRRWHLSRKGYELVDVASGKDRGECEMRFFTGWLARQNARADIVTQVAKRAGQKPAQQESSTDPDEVIGLFPEAGR